MEKRFVLIERNLIDINEIIFVSPIKKITPFYHFYIYLKNGAQIKIEQYNSKDELSLFEAKRAQIANHICNGEDIINLDSES